MVNNNHWNSKIENNLKILSKSCQIYSIMHEKSSVLYKHIDLGMGILSGLLTALTATLITIPSFSTQNRKEPETIVYSTILFFSSFINFTQQFLSLKTHSQQNLIYSKKYQILFSDIKKQLSFYRSERIEAKSFQLDVFEQFNNLIVNQPEISYFVNLSFVKNKGIFIPLSGDTESIDLDVKSEEYNSQENEKEIYGNTLLVDNNRQIIIKMDDQLSYKDEDSYYSDSSEN